MRTHQADSCRHGDKAKEMQLVDFRDYVTAAETLVSHNPLNLKRVAFVSSEDPDVIKEAARMRRIDTGADRQPPASQAGPSVQVAGCQRKQHTHERNEEAAASGACNTSC